MASRAATVAPARPLPPWIIALLGLVALVQVSNWLPPSWGLPHSALLNSIPLDLLCWLAAWQLHRAAARDDLPSEVRRALRWAVWPVVMQAVEGLVLIGMYGLGTLEVHGSAWTNLPLVASDLIGQGSEVMILVFLLKLPPSGQARRGTLRAVVDGLTFVVGAGVPLWLFSLRPLLAASTNVDELFTATGPLISFAGLLILSWALETRGVPPNRAAYKMLLVAPALLLLSDIIFSIGKASGLDYPLMTRLNFLFLSIAFGGWLLAGWKFRTGPTGPVERRPLVAFSPLPMITIVAAASFFMVIVLLGGADAGLYARLLLVFFLFLLILLARESFVIRDSLQLVAIEAGRKTQARYEALVQHSSDFLLVVDAQHRIGFASPAVERLLRVPAASLAGRDFLDFIHPEERGAARGFLQRLAARPEHLEVIQWRFFTPDGLSRQMETVGNNQLAEPDIAGLVLNSRDISERLQMEAQLRQSQKMDAIGQLAGGVAHDFNNILTAIQLQLELLRGDYPGDAKLRGGLDELKESAMRAAGLTRQLLMFGRRQIVQPQPVELDALLGNLLKMLRRLIGENISIEFQPNQQPTWVTADPGMLEQVVMNLVVNARDAVATGGRITLATGLSEFPAGGPPAHPEGRAGRFVTIRVTDTGHGMDPDTLQRIFEPFFTTKELGRGTGLGLATVYGIVRQHDGWIDVQSAPGRGTTFIVHLPASPAPGATDTAADAAPVAGGREGVLLVEDDPTVRTLAQTVLRQAGYSVLTAHSGPEALERWATAGGRNLRLLITDMVMPGGLSGLELAQRLRQQQPALKVIVMSGYSRELSTTGLSADAGVVFLPKPFLSDELRRSVRQALESA